MNRSGLTRLAAGCALATSLLAGAAHAADAKPFRIGLILPMTGQSASTGKQVEAAAKLYLAQNGATVAGRKIELIVKDDAGVADATRRLAQELVVNDKVDVLAGFGLTPLALAAAPIATQSKTPMVVMAAATSIVTEQSPYIVRTSFTLPQVTLGIAEWAAKNKIRKAVTMVADYAPGIDAERTLGTASGSTAARSSARCARRYAAPISRRSCRRWPTSSPTPCSSSCPPARARRS